MQVTPKEFRRAVRDFQDIISDLMQSDYQNYIVNVERFISFISNDKILWEILNPYLQIKIDQTKYIPSYKNKWHYEIPSDDNIRISLILNMFEDIMDKQLDINEIAFSCYKNPASQYNIQKLNNELIYPALRKIENQMTDYLEDMKGNEELEITSQTVLNIHNESGTIVMGNNNSVTNTITIEANQIPEKVSDYLISQGATYEQISKIYNDLVELKEELLNPQPEESIIKKIFSKVKDVVGTEAIKGVINLLCNFEVIKNIQSSVPF